MPSRRPPSSPPPPGSRRAPAPPPPPAPGRRRPARTAAAAALLLLLGLLVLRPVLSGGWLWDDEREVTENRILRAPAPLASIWLAPAGPDYFPLKTTAQWLEWRAWGARPAGYHAVSLALHLASALLVWRILRRLGARWGWLGGLLFAVHPLAVESVAWAAELKNTLSLVLLLLAADAWLDWDDAYRPGAYARALGFFLAALLAKSSVVLLPGVLLLHAWWKRGRIGARDGAATAPFFAAAGALGLVTLRFQHAVAIGGWTIDAGGPATRAVRALAALGFYFQKAAVPAGLSPLYAPALVAPSPLHFLPAAAFLALAGWAWARRATWGRTVLLGLGFFALNLLPVVGLFAMSYMRYSWVADHFAYISVIGIAGLAAAGLGALSRRAPIGAVVAAVAVAGVLAVESNAYARVFHDSRSLWTRVLARDPGSWAAEDHLGEVDVQEGRLASGIDHYATALRLQPDLPEAHSGLGYAYLLAGQPARSIAELREALRLGYVNAHTNLGNALAQVGDANGAIAEEVQALQFEPDSPDVEVNLANALTQAGRAAESLPHYERALRLDPAFAEGRYNWAVALEQLGRLPEAAGQLELAARAAPTSARIWGQWGVVLAQAHRLPEAEERLAEAARLAPADADTQANLGLVLLQENRPRDAIAPLEAAVRLNPGLAGAWRSLALARQRAGGP